MSHPAFDIARATTVSISKVEREVIEPYWKDDKGPYA